MPSVTGDGFARQRAHVAAHQDVPGQQVRTGQLEVVCAVDAGTAGRVDQRIRRGDAVRLELGPRPGIAGNHRPVVAEALGARHLEPFVTLRDPFIVPQDLLRRNRWQLHVVDRDDAVVTGSGEAVASESGRCTGS